MLNKNLLLSITCLGVQLILTGCGQTGSLYLPDKSAKAETQLPQPTSPPPQNLAETSSSK